MNHGDYKQVEDYLQQYRFLNRRIHEYELELMELKRKQENRALDFLRPRVLDGIWAKSNSDADKVGEAVAMVIDVYAKRMMRISRKIKEIFKQMAQIEAIVDNAGLNDIEYYLIKQRYFEGENMSFIAVDIGYSERGAREIKYRALKKIYQEMVRKHILKCQYA